ncbi:succinate dehydrogenase assembly factor 2 [Phaeobacter sp. HF9A]|uniref:succinate dehydrogenase assembly factor 2 n=1 Tax=Phaeobacter sp. HF9A TaxID=2721561 RepID=UPI00142FD440|nr:succinate dehydrogenase assembly factor 2 [Phaeobacter sp. HF9A]NIZ15150.1 succinate dehydrogenase assembly factor 2 [Phaeobacter sp. HF9A]
MEESRETRIKRLSMRSMRRGIKEMDILLSGYATANLAAMDAEKMDLYDHLLRENDQDLYQWVTGQVPAPEGFRELIGEIARTYEK